MSFCTKCGTELKEDAKFCPSCGAPAEPKAEPAAEEKAARAKYRTAEYISAEYYV